MGEYEGSCFCGAVEETVLHVPDGNPKQKDVPAELGGSAVLLAE